MRFLIFLLLLCSPLFATGEAVTKFLNIQNKLLQGLPESFKGELKSKNIEKNLNNIPKDSYLDKKGRVYVEVGYSKKEGITFIVKNVDELYRDLYKNLSKQIFAFDLLLSKTDTNLINKYEIEVEGESETSLILNLRIKNSENKVALYIDKNINKVLRVDYFMGKNFINSTVILYKDVKNYSIPYKFISKNLTSKEKTTPDIYEIDNIQIK